MNFTNLVRQHWAALRALLVLTVITGFVYPLVVWGVALLPGLHAKAEGSIVNVSGKPVGSKLIGQLFTDKDGNPLPQYFQSRPSAAGTGYDPTGIGSHQPGPGEHRRHARRPEQAGAGCRSVHRRVQAEPADPGVLAQRRDRQARERRRVTPVLHRRRGRRGAVGDRAAGLVRQRESIRPRWSASTNRARSPEAHRPRSSSSSTRACGCNAPSTVRTTRRVRSCPFAARRRTHPPCLPMPSPPALAAWTRDISPAYADIQVARVAQRSRDQRRTGA